MWVPQGRLEHLVLAARPAKTAHDFARRHEKRLDCSGDSGERAGRRGGGWGGTGEVEEKMQRGWLK